MMVSAPFGTHADSFLQRYINPLIAPPTPPQLEQDKKEVDEEFSRAFALIDQLSTDTAALKSAEEARTERLDSTLKDVENLVSDLKTASRRRDDETRRISDEVKTLKDAIPKALQGAREGNEHRLKELGTELKSLKVLLGNRLGGGATPGPSAAGRAATPTNSGLPVSSRPAEEPAAPAPAPTAAANGSTAPAPTNGAESQPSPAGTATPASPSPLSQLGKSASIPAWQMAAANRNKKPSTDEGNPATGNSTSTSTEQQSAPAS